MTPQAPAAEPGFEEEFTGELLAPDHPDYDEVRRVHNGLIDKRPGLIARCHNASEVVAAVNYGREMRMEISIRGGGHNVAGKAISDGGLMIDLAPMKAVHVDPAAKIVRAQPGASWGDYNQATQQFGLATTGGVISSTGIAGLTLGGGLGWIMGKYGMAHDNLIGAQIVTAEGELITASEHENPDLFWALRGGGGNFGVVVWFEYRAYELSTVHGGLVAYPAAEAAEIFRRYRDLTAAGLPDELTIFCGYGKLPDGRDIIALPGCHVGPTKQAEADLRPFRELSTPALDAFAEIPYGLLNSMQDEGFPRGARNYWKSAFLRELDDEVIDVIDAAAAAAPSPMSTITIEHVHGAATRVAPTATAYPHREPGYNFVLIAQWLDPVDDEANIAWARETFDAVAPFLADANYVNYLDDDDGGRVKSAYGENWDRLVSIKRRYDPGNLFRLNQNIDPQ